MVSINKFILEILRKIDKKPFQKFFENLHAFSLHGMGYGECEIEVDGEREVLKNLNKENKKNKRLIIFDVGANKGDYSLECVKFVKNAEIYAFEPSKKAFEMLKKNLRCSKVKSHNFGFGEKEKNVSLFYDNEGTALASIYNRKLDYRKIYFTKKEKIKIKTIDSFCKENSIDKIDLLKIDVEGNELNVLKGAKK